MSQPQTKSRLRCWLVPALLLLPVIFICGKLLLTQVTPGIRTNNSGGGFLSVNCGAPCTGWPWVFWQGALFGQDFSIDWRLYVADIAVLVFVGLGIWLLLIYVWRRLTAGFRFTIRELLIFTAIVASVCAWIAFNYNQRRNEVRSIEIISRSLIFQTEYVGPQFLLRFFPDQMLGIFHRVTLIVGPANDNLLEAVGCFSKMRHFEIYDCGTRPLPEGQITDVGMAYLKNCSNLEQLTFAKKFGLQVTDEGIDQLRNLPRLEIFELPGKGITDRTIESLFQMKALRYLAIAHSTEITDDGIRRIAKLPNLATLELPNRKLPKDIFDLLLKRPDPILLIIDGKFAKSYEEAREIISPTH